MNGRRRQRPRRPLPRREPRAANAPLPRKRRRPGLPSPAIVLALIALVFSTTGLADAARHAVESAVGGHAVSSKPKANALLLLGKNRKFPAAAIPTVDNAKRVDGEDGRTARRNVPARDRRSRDLVPGLRAVPADEGRGRQEQLRVGLEGM